MDIPVTCLGESFFANSRPSSITHKLFKFCLIRAPSTYCCMQRESHKAYSHGACELGLTLQVITFQLLDEATNVLAFANSKCDFVLSTSCLNASKRVISITGICDNVVPRFVLLRMGFSGLCRICFGILSSFLLAKMLYPPVS